MARLVRGENLSSAQVEQVKAAFVYRPTIENGYPQHNPCGATVAAISDEQWIKEHAFYIRSSDGRLADKPSYCEPYFMGEIV